LDHVRVNLEEPIGEATVLAVQQKQQGKAQSVRSTLGHDELLIRWSESPAVKAILTIPFQLLHALKKAQDWRRRHEPPSGD
ncbi:MAG TPA: hypothetical protein VKP69_19795, partial [Isosphaeraceae bacterium]|nr:hypothetical protein [Isosphaeraceae bacterium]